MKNDIEELKNVADQLLIEASISQMQISNLEMSFFDLASKTLNEVDFAKLKSDHYHTLIEQSNQKFSGLYQLVYHKKTAMNVHFEFHSHLKRLIGELK